MTHATRRSGRLCWLVCALVAAAAAQDAAGLYQVAEAAYGDKDYPKAIASFKSFVERYPDDRLAPRALHRIGECHGALNRFEDAALAFQLCYKRYPDSNVADSALFNEGFYFFRAQKWHPAAFAYAAYTKKGTNQVYRAQAHYWRGEALYELDRYTDAVAAYQELLKLPAETLRQPSVASLVPYARYSIAVSHFEAKQYEPALAAAKAALAADPQSPVTADTLWYGGQALRQLKQTDEAVKWLWRLVGEHPKSPLAPDALSAIVELEQARGRRDAAQKALDRLAKDYPNASQQGQSARLRVAAERLAAKDFAGAQKLYREALAGATGDAAAAALLGLAEASFELQQWPEAAQHYRALLDQHPQYPGCPRARLRLGETLLRQGDHAGAEKLYREILQARPTGSEAVLARYNLAIAVYQQGRKDDAATLYREVAQQDPAGETGAQALLEVGRLLLEGRQYAEARTAYQDFLRSRAARPEAPQAWWGVGECSYALKDWPRAADAYQTLVDKYPKHNLVERAYYRLGEVYQAQGQTDKANQVAAILRQRFPASKLTAATTFARGRDQFKVKDYAGAVASFESFLKEYPEHDDAPVARANLAASLYLAESLPNHWVRAAEAYAELGRRHPTIAPDAFFWAGSAYLEAGEQRSAVEALRAFLKAQPQNVYAPRGQFLLGKALLGANLPAEAVPALQQAVDDAKNDPALRSEARSELAWALLGAGREEEAYATFAAVAQDDATSKFAAEARFHLAGRLHAQRKYAEAEAAYGDWLKTFPEHPLRARVHYNLALSQESRGDFAAAAASYEQAGKLLPKADEDLRQQAGYRRGYCLFKAGDQAAALQALDAFNTTWPNSKLKVEAAYWRGRVLLAQSKWPEAAAVLKAIADDQPDHLLAPSARLNLGVALQNQQKYAEAAAAYLSLTKQAGLPDEVVADALVHLGEVLYAQKQYDEGLDALLRAELGKVETVRPAARYWAAMCYLQKGEDAKAREKLTKVINDYPQSEWAQKAKAALNNPGG